MRTILGAGVVAGALLMAPAQAAAQVFLDVGIGTSSGKHVSPERTATGQLGGFGRMVGFEGDFGVVTRTPFHGVVVRTLNGSLLVGPKITASFGRLRPYGSIGGGVLGTATTVTEVVNPFNSANRLDPNVSFGGGVIYQLPNLPALGVRFDVRHFLDLHKEDVKEAAITMTRITVSFHWTFKDSGQ